MDCVRMARYFQSSNQPPLKHILCITFSFDLLLSNGVFTSYVTLMFIHAFVQVC